MSLPAINNWVASWVVFCARNAKIVCLAFALLCVFFTSFVVNNLGINTKTTDMLSEKLDWQQNLQEHEQQFPQLTDTLVAVVDAETPMLALRAAEQLAASLAKETELFHDVYMPNGGDFFRQNGLLYLEIDALEELIEELAKIQPFVGRLQRGEGLSAYFNLLEQSLVTTNKIDQAAVDRLMRRTSTAIDALQNNQFHRMRWDDKGNTRQLIILKPKLAFEQLLPARQAMQSVQDITQKLKLDQAHGVSVRMTGTIALQNDELTLLASSMPLGGLIALVLVSLVLFFAMRHPVLILSSVTTLIVGLIATAAFAAFSVGQLNLISVAFAVLFIGLGVDFAIHFCLRYKELLTQNIKHLGALHKTANDVGTSLLLCSITTSAGFFAFIPTSFKGVSELGIISGAGIIISLITTLSLLPALLSLWPIKTPKLYEKNNRFSQHSNAFSERIIRDPKNSKRILIGFGTILIASTCTLPFVSFDNNPLNLRSPESESVAAYQDLLNDSQTSPLSLSARGKNRHELEVIQAQLERLPTVDRVIGFGDFVPSNQDQKLDLIADLELILGGNVANFNNGETLEKQLQAIDSLISAIEGKRQNSDNKILADLQAKLSVLKNELFEQQREQQSDQLKRLSESLLADLLLQIQRIQDGLYSEGVQQATLPDALVKRWHSESGFYKLQILPSEDMRDNTKAAEFVDTVTKLAPNATGESMINLKAGSTIVQAFQQAFMSAFVLIFLLLLLLLRNLRDAFLVLTPLLLTAPLIVAVTVLLGTPFNYANIITLPLLLGISVDNGVHMVHRARHALPGSDHLLASSTGRAIIFSSLTTVFSFGNLAFSPHIGTASMGLLLSIGMICGLLCTLLLLPILLNRPNKADSA